MPQYTILYCPELLLKVPGTDSDKSRYKAIQIISLLLNEGQLKVKLPEGFSTRQLIEITKQDLMAENEYKITEAVKIISKLSAAKQTTQELHEQALQTRGKIDVLFGNQVLTKQDFDDIENNLKIIKNFAIANLRYKEALCEAEKARRILDETLKLSEEQIFE
ncbi:MAG: hypothetical protein KME49_31445 [Brasilonema octagenarum HA4186-MV1]|jgi:esterase/lipase|nr:hypothetical protein [Brasilonema octagenarum HA4186-MV1]